MKPDIYKMQFEDIELEEVTRMWNFTIAKNKNSIEKPRES